MRVRNKRVLKNGTVAGYVQQEDGSWKWRFIGGSKKTTKKKTTTKKRGGMMRLVNGIKGVVGMETSTQRAERERQERAGKLMTRIHLLNQECQNRRTGMINFNNISSNDMHSYLRNLGNLNQLSQNEQIDVYCELRKYSDWVGKVANRNVHTGTLNDRMREILNILVGNRGINNGNGQPRNNGYGQPRNIGNGQPRNNVNRQPTARGGRRTRKTKTRKTKTKKSRK